MITPQSETQHQQCLISWKNNNVNRYPALRLLFAIPNEGRRDMINAARMKAQGLLAGVSDLCLPVAKHGYNVLFIELKKPGGKLTTSQKTWGQLITEHGGLFVVCCGWEAARDLLVWYIDGGKDGVALLFLKSDPGDEYC